MLDLIQIDNVAELGRNGEASFTPSNMKVAGMYLTCREYAQMFDLYRYCGKKLVMFAVEVGERSLSTFG